MQIPHNTFHNALRAGDSRIGLWVRLAGANAAELLAGCGFDGLLLDAEHAPNDVGTVLLQLRALAPYPFHSVVRPVRGDIALLKQYLDVGAQTLLIPMIDTTEQAESMVRAMRYPPAGVRGMSAALARASRRNQEEDYTNQADAQMCLLVQVETAAALASLDGIASVPGVDRMFFGPADLSASMGFRGQGDHPAVREAILDGFRRVRADGRARCIDGGPGGGARLPGGWSAIRRRRRGYIFASARGSRTGATLQESGGGRPCLRRRCLRRTFLAGKLEQFEENAA